MVVVGVRTASMDGRMETPERTLSAKSWNQRSLKGSKGRWVTGSVDPLKNESGMEGLSAGLERK